MSRTERATAFFETTSRFVPGTLDLSVLVLVLLVLVIRPPGVG